MSLITGTVSLDGATPAGVTVHLINTTPTPAEHVATTTTDANGNFSYETDVDGEIHVAVQYDDGTVKYNAESQPGVESVSAGNTT